MEIDEKDNGKFQVVDATPDDVEGISNLLSETWLATYPNEEAGITKEDIIARFSSPEVRSNTEERKKTVNSKPSEHTWVIRDGEIVVGMAAGVKEADKGWVQALYVSPVYQGQGLGKKLLRTGMEWLGNEKPIFIHAASYNINAINFYKSFGFIETGIPVKSSVAPLPSGVMIPEIELRRDVI